MLYDPFGQSVCNTSDLVTRFDSLDVSLAAIQNQLENTQEIFINDSTIQTALTLESNWVNNSYVGVSLAVLPGQLYIDNNYYYLIGIDFKPIRLLKDSKLINIENKIDQLLSTSSQNGLSLTLLTLIPVYQFYSSTSWYTAPQNLQALYDNDAATASNLFEINGAQWAYGEIILLPGISIPRYTRIQMKIGLQNAFAQRSVFEVAVFDVIRGSYINIWSYFGLLSNTQDLIANIDVIVPFTWDKLKFLMWDIGHYMPRGRFYDLKVWEVS